MAKKPTLQTISTDVAGLDSALNSNLSLLRTSFDNTLSLDGSTPNAMQADFDLNSNDLINGGFGYFDEVVVDGIPLLEQVQAAQAAATAAGVSETNAANSANAAASSASSAASSAATALGVLDELPDWQGAWLTATAYALGDLVQENGNTYIAVVAHTSGTFATDLGAGKWELFASKGDSGAGTGDLVSTNNLSDVSNASVARTNLGLAIGTNVQAYNATLATIASSGVIAAMDIAGTTAITSPDLADELVVYDSSGGVNRAIRSDDFFKVVTTFALNSNVDKADTIFFHDTTAAGSRRATVENFLSAVNSLTTAAAIDSANDTMLVYDASAGAARKETISNLLTAASNGVLIVQDEKPSGTDGGSTVASTWTTRTLNTVRVATIAGVSLSSNRVTLPAGTYRVRASSPVGRGGAMRHKCRVYNITDGSTLILGSSEHNGGSSSQVTRSFATGQFTLASTKDIVLQYWTNVARATDGLGLATSSGENEVYGIMEIEKI